MTKLEEYLIPYTIGSNKWGPLERFHKSLGIHPPPWAGSLYALRLERSRYHDVYLINDDILEIIGKIPYRPYSMGMYYGMLFPNRFVPSLPLAHFLANKALDLGIPVTILSEDGERHFLYGRSVFKPNFRGWRPGIMLVLNEKREALGWGEGRIVKISGARVRAVEPVWDLGWYLRRGG